MTALIDWCPNSCFCVVLFVFALLSVLICELFCEVVNLCHEKAPNHGFKKQCPGCMQHQGKLHREIDTFFDLESSRRSFNVHNIFNNIHLVKNLLPILLIIP